MKFSVRHIRQLADDGKGYRNIHLSSHILCRLALANGHQSRYKNRALALIVLS